MPWPDIEPRDEGSTASPLSAPAWSCLLNYTSVQLLPLFSLPSSLLNLIRESADAVCARLMWNQFKASHKKFGVSFALSLTHTRTPSVCVICLKVRDPRRVIICIERRSLDCMYIHVDEYMPLAPYPIKILRQHHQGSLSCCCQINSFVIRIRVNWCFFYKLTVLNLS